MAERIYSAAELLTHDNYSTSTMAATKTLPIRCSFIFIRNTDSTDKVQVSFDGGSTYFDIGPGASLSIDVDFPGGGVGGTGQTYKVKSSANTPAAQCIYGSEA